MTVRFKSEYQKSYRVSRSRSTSPKRSAPLAGLRSDQMGVGREPGFQHRRRFGSVPPPQICSSLLWPSEPDQTRTSRTNLVQPPPARPAPPAGSRSCSAQREEKPPTPPGPLGEPGTPGEPAKPHPSQPDNQPQTRDPLTALDGQQLVANGVQRALRWRAGQRSDGQFSLKTPATAASPILTAQQVLYSRSPAPRLHKHLDQSRVPLFHKHTRNRKKGEGPDRKPHPQQELSSPQKESMRSQSPKKATPPPPPHRRPRIQEVDEVTHGTIPQVEELRQRAMLYRRRAWGTHFSRDHLSQLLSEHNALWEATDSTTQTPSPHLTQTPSPHLTQTPSPHLTQTPSPHLTQTPSPHLTQTPSPHLSSDLAHTTALDPDVASTSCVEALDLASTSSRTSMAAVGDTPPGPPVGDTPPGPPVGDTPPGPPVGDTPPGRPADRRLAWGEEEESDDEEGRLPTPRLKIRPVQRTHHDLTTPATGGALLVGGLRRTDPPSPCRLERCGTAVSMAAGVETVDDLPHREEVWPGNRPAHNLSYSPNHKQPPSPAFKPIRMKPSLPTPPPPAHLAPPPPHRIQGMLRHPEFQHNGELGLKFREFQCPGGGCTSDEDDRLSVMSWRSAASCTAASAVLERAQKRRDNFWGKR